MNTQHDCPSTPTRNGLVMPWKRIVGVDAGRVGTRRETPYGAFRGDHDASPRS